MVRRQRVGFYTPTVVEASAPPLKVVFDKVVALALIALTSPIWLLIGLAILVESAVIPGSRGGLIHRELRVSGGQVFTLRKFRILRPAGEAAIRAGAVPKEVENDRRNLTRVGWILKKLGFDELPQLLSIVTGEMSLVGPRPKPVVEYEEEIRRGHVFRAELRAGLTGPTQAMKGTDRTGEEKDQAEFEYLDLMRTGSAARILCADILILIKTIRVVVGAYGE